MSSRKTRFALAGLVFLGALAGLATMAVRVQGSLQAAEDGANAVTHTHEVRWGLKSVSAGLSKAESGRRGLIIMHTSELADQYNQGLQTLRDSVTTLKSLLTDNPRQLRHLSRLESLIDRKTSGLEESLRIQKEDPGNNAAQIAITRRGHELTEDIDMVLREMTAEEDFLLSSRHDIMQTRVRETQRMLLAAAVACAIMMIIAFVIVLGEMTGRHRTENALIERNAQYRGLVEANILGIFTCELEGRIDEANDAFLESLGHTREEVASGQLSWVSLTPPEYRALDDRARSELRAHGYVSTYEKEYLRKDGTRVPVLVGLASVGETRDGKCIGVMLDLSERKREQEEVRRANELLDVKVKELEMWTGKVDVLGEMGELLQTSLTREESRTIITRFSAKLFPESSGRLWFKRSSGDYLELALTFGPGSTKEEIFPPRDCWAVRSGKPQHFGPSGKATIACAHLGEDFSGEAICIPLMAAGEAIGVLHIDRASAFSEAERRLAVALAESIALAEANTRLAEKLRTQAIRDPLTGLFNRRYLEESMERELKRAERKGSEVGVVMLDVDHFKAFNDRHGHSGGDALLSALGALLQKIVRAEDIVCRYGGEEIAIILPDASLETAAARAEQVRKAISQLKVKHAGRTLDSVSASLGVAAFPSHGITMAELLSRADRALYAAKRAGRNRVFTAESAPGTVDLPAKAAN